MRVRLRLATLVTVALAAGGAALLGPFVLPLVFGPDVTLGSFAMALVATGCALAVTNLVLTVSGLAQGRSSSVARCWLGSVLAAGLTYVALTGLPLEDTVIWSFLAAEAAAFALLSVVEARAPGHAGAAAGQAPGLVAARKTDDPNGTSRLRSTRCSAPDSRRSSRWTGSGTEVSRPSPSPAGPLIRRSSRSATKNGNTAPNAYVARVDHEPGALGEADETRPGVAPVVSRLDVVVGPGPLVRRNRQQHPAPGPQHAGQLGHGQRLALAVLDHVERGHHVERLVRERQRLGGPADALTGSEPAGEQVEGDPAVAALHPADARAVGTAHVEDRGRRPEVRPQHRVSSSARARNHQ